MLKIGIVGLPNVGKSTLFNAITNSEIEAANYPFATIEPNKKIIEIIDERLLFLAQKFQSQKIIYNQIEFIDIAGLVRGASKGEGLGNKFLSTIREVDLIVEVIRFFEDETIIHVETKINPLRDIKIIETELIIADLNQVEKWLDKNARKFELSKSEKERAYVKIMHELNSWLSEEKLIKSFPIESSFLQEFIDQFSFLSAKPILYLANVSESEVTNFEANQFFKDFLNHVEINKGNYLFLCAQLEYEISKIEALDEKQIFLDEYNLKDSGLNELSKLSFSVLNWKTYFTAGPKEAHAWAFLNGFKAPQAAGIIHTDFERGFIKVEVYNYEDFYLYSSELILKEKGLMRLEGKDYLVKDGDICNFKFNV